MRIAPRRTVGGDGPTPSPQDTSTADARLLALQQLVPGWRLLARRPRLRLLVLDAADRGQVQSVEHRRPVLRAPDLRAAAHAQLEVGVRALAPGAPADPHADVAEDDAVRIHRARRDHDAVRPLLPAVAVQRTSQVVHQGFLSPYLRATPRARSWRSRLRSAPRRYPLAKP